MGTLPRNCPYSNSGSRGCHVGRLLSLRAVAYIRPAPFGLKCGRWGKAVRMSCLVAVKSHASVARIQLLPRNPCHLSSVHQAIAPN